MGPREREPRQWDPDDCLRLFFAVVLPPELQEAVGGLQERLRDVRAEVTWVAAHNLHFTIKFIGHVPARMVRDLRQAAATVAVECEPHTVEVAGVGAFPSLKRPQTIWVGVGEGAPALSALAAHLIRALDEGALVPRDARPFRPHCTIGRARNPKDAARLAEALGREAGFAAGRMTCDSFQLMSSELKPSGPTYTRIATFPLRARGEGLERTRERGGVS